MIARDMNEDLQLMNSFLSLSLPLVLKDLMMQGFSPIRKTGSVMVISIKRSLHVQICSHDIMYLLVTYLGFHFLEVLTWFVSFHGKNYMHERLYVSWKKYGSMYFQISEKMLKCC